MTVRTGMTALILRFRALVNDADASTFTDEQAQTLLDRYAGRYVQIALTSQPVQVNGSVEYKVFGAPVSDCEGPESGSDRWRVYDSTGAEASTSDYTAYPDRGEIVFSTSQTKAYYLDCFSYDVYAAAADAYMQLAATAATGVDFSDGGVGFKMSQRYDHYMKMAEQMRAMSKSPRGNKPRARTVSMMRSGT